MPTSVFFTSTEVVNASYTPAALPSFQNVLLSRSSVPGLIAPLPYWAGAE